MDDDTIEYMGANETHYTHGETQDDVLTRCVRVLHTCMQKWRHGKTPRERDDGLSKLRTSLHRFSGTSWDAYWLVPPDDISVASTQKIG